MLDTAETSWAQEGESFKGEKVQAFVEQISVADGSLIELPGVRSPLDEPIFISARVGRSIFFESDGHHLLLLDVFVRTNMGVYEPIGRYDIQIAGDKVVDNRNRHDHLEYVHEAHKAAADKWPTAEGFKLESINFMNHAWSIGSPKGWLMMKQYRELGIVTSEEQWSQPVYKGLGVEELMIAAAACVLKSRGVNVINPLIFNPNEKIAWASFGSDGLSYRDVDDILSRRKTIDTLRKFTSIK